MKPYIVLVCLLSMMSSGCTLFLENRPMDEKYMVEHQNLIDKAAVHSTVNQLFISTDNRDWNTVEQLFAPQVLFDMTSLAGGEPVTLTPKDIVSAWDKGLKALEAIHHQTGNYVITVNGNKADVFCYGTASHYLKNQTNQNTRIFVGSYDFHLIKTGEAWQIDRFKFNLKYMDGNLNLEGS